MVAILGLDRGAEATAIIAATQAILRERGLAGVTMTAVLAQAELGTRAFYRHFGSKDQLLVEVFTVATMAEVERLRRLMEPSGTPGEAVAAWIEGRLALGFDDEIESDLRHLSQQAQALYRVAPETMAELYSSMMLPLVQAIGAGIASGEFAAGDPWVFAESIASVVWARVEQEWLAPSEHPAAVRAQTLVFCLSGLGVSPEPSHGAGEPARSAARARGRA